MANKKITTTETFKISFPDNAQLRITPHVSGLGSIEVELRDRFDEMIFQCSFSEPEMADFLGILDEASHRAFSRTPTTLTRSV
jgi:hypothetical protein